MNIDDVIEEFNIYLDEYNEPIIIQGIHFNPSEILNDQNIIIYLKELDKYISEHYQVLDSGEVFIPL